MRTQTIARASACLRTPMLLQLITRYALDERLPLMIHAAESNRER
ncbi:MAG: hypothetical protein WKF84_21930 [Pyrinomonadaceae bacterium]